MATNIKFMVAMLLVFLVSCSSQDSHESSKNISKAPYSDIDSNFKYNSIYNKLVVELLLHKNKHDDALETFISNIKYFNEESDFLRMINKARDMRKFGYINKISSRWLQVDPLNISAHKIAFSNSLEISSYDQATYHWEFLFNAYKKNNNKSYINLEDILSRNIIVNNIVEFFEMKIEHYNSDELLFYYIQILQQNDLDSLVIPYLSKISNPNNRTISRKYSNSLAKINRTEEAIDVLENYIALSTITDREALFDLLGLYLQKKDKEMINKLVRKLVNIDPEDNDFMFRLALLFFDKNNFDFSEKYFNILLSKSYAPDNINFFLGQIDFNNGRYIEALRHYEKIQQGTFINTKLLNVAKALHKQYGISRAISYLEEEVKIKTKNDLFNLLSLKLSLYQDPYDLNKVIDLSNKILKSFPKNERALYTRALAYEKNAEIENMMKDFEIMINSDPYNSVALNAYGYSLSLHNKNLKYAEKLIQRALKVDPGNPAILDSLAWVLYLNGSYEKAYKYSKLAYSKDQDPEIVGHYYKILLKKGYADEAQRILQQSIKNNPGNESLLNLLNHTNNESAQL